MNYDGDVDLDIFLNRNAGNDTHGIFPS